MHESDDARRHVEDCWQRTRNRCEEGQNQAFNHRALVVVAIPFALGEEGNNPEHRSGGAEGLFPDSPLRRQNSMESAASVISAMDAECRRFGQVRAQLPRAGDTAAGGNQGFHSNVSVSSCVLFLFF